MNPSLRWLRAVPIALLGLALWNPALPWGRAAMDIVILLDDSASVDRGEITDAWRQLAELSDLLEESGQLSVSAS